jgi:hypothetical protein
MMSLRNSLRATMSVASDSDVSKLLKITHISNGGVTEESDNTVSVSDNSINTDFRARGYNESDCNTSDVSDSILNSPSSAASASAIRRKQGECVHCLVISFCRLIIQV